MVLLGALALSAGAIWAPASAAAIEVDFSVSFPDLAPGETRTESASVTLDRDAVLEEIVWPQAEGLLAESALSAVVCSGRTCVDQDALVPTAIPAGPVRVEVTVSAPKTIEPDAAGSALGRLTFVADDEHLASTAVGAPLASTGAMLSRHLLWGGAMLVGAGIVLTAIAMRRRQVAGPKAGQP